MSPEETPLLKEPGPCGAPAPVVSTDAISTSSLFGSAFELGDGAGAGAGRRRLPQNIGHRGYKAAFPENSMAAFQGALTAGADALETDLHMSRDGVVVLSHDATLKRCFGVDARVADCDWSYLRTLRTVQEPRQPMLRLADLLRWLASPAAAADAGGADDADDADEARQQTQTQTQTRTQSRLGSVWLLLDIKTDDDPEALLPAIAEAIASVPISAAAAAAGVRSWRERIVLGAWNEHYINHCRAYLPGYQLAYIGFSLLYARRFLSDDHPDVHFNLFQPTLVGPVGARFRREARERGRRLFVWTVNKEHWMEWAVRKGVDGVITDEVGRFREVRERFGRDGRRHAAAGAAAAAGAGAAGAIKVETASAMMAGDRPRREPAGWPRVARLYAGVILLQACAMVLSLLLWRQLATRGGPKGKRKRQPVGKPVMAKA